MKRCYKRILAMMLALVMTFSYMPESVIQIVAAPLESTESVDTPVEQTENAEVFFVHSATNKLITLNGTQGAPIDCNTTYSGVSSSVPNSARFTIYYGKGTTTPSKDKTVVNFTCLGTQTSWGANANSVYQIGKRTNPAGWESVIMEPQGDGTVAFRNCDNGNYITMADNKLSIIDIGEGESISANEKFVIHSAAKPKTAKKVTLSNVSGDSIDVSWQGVDECLYSGYEVLYSTTETGTYISAGYTADTKLVIKGLNLNTRYFVKVRTLTNKEDGGYADSAVVYTQTLKDYKPAKPSGVSVEQQEDGKMKITWKKANSALKYKVYRAVSRFAEYKEIGETTNLTFTDNTPNTSSRYRNYYKVQGVNNYDEGDFSDPGSLEISMFGKNMYVFNETDDFTQIYETTQQVYLEQKDSQFGDERYVLAFKSGDYSGITEGLNMGYYTQTIGLGKTPYDVRINNVRTPAALSGNNATCNFWRGIENLTIADTDGNDGDPYYYFQWGVSQAAPARRLYVERMTTFDWYYGWASGGYVADSYFEKAAGSYSQQQYYYRNCYINGGIYGVNWNQVVQGVEGINADNSSDNSGKPFANMVDLINKNGTTNWDQRGCSTIIPTTPIIREKPFLYFDEATDEYKVFVPAMKKNSSGVSWSYESMGAGTSLSVEKSFYVAHPDRDTAETLNYQLAIGKNIIFSPGIYHVDKPLEVISPDTIILGLGMATIIPDNKEAAIKTADVSGLAICGLILDAGNYSEALLVMGEERCNKSHENNPSVIQDVIYRVGGTGELGRADVCQIVNSNDVIIDHTWIWRADHGDNTGWDENTSKNGLIVNGDNVTAYGLFVEHFQEYDIVWRGEYGTTYFLQNEKCYDPQSQKGWMSHGGQKKGYAAYKVANNVKNHYAIGLGVYDVFINTNGASIYLDNAIEVPNTPNVLIENACIVEIASEDGPKVGINHIINDTTEGINTGGGAKY